MPPGVLADLLSAQKDWLKQLEGSRGPGFAALLVWAAFLTTRRLPAAVPVARGSPEAAAA